MSYINALSTTLKKKSFSLYHNQVMYLNPSAITSRSRWPVLVLSQRILFAEVATNRCSVEAGEKQTFSAESRWGLSTFKILTSTWSNWEKITHASEQMGWVQDLHISRAIFSISKGAPPESGTKNKVGPLGRHSGAHLALSLHSKKVLGSTPTQAFLCGFCIFSLCLCGFSPGTLASPHSPKTCTTGDI